MRMYVWLAPFMATLGILPNSVCAQSRWVEIAQSVSARIFMDSNATVRPNGHFEVTLRWHYEGWAQYYTIQRADVDCVNDLVRTRYQERVQHVGLPGDQSTGAVASVWRTEPERREWFSYPPGSLGRVALDGTCRALGVVG